MAGIFCWPLLLELLPFPLDVYCYPTPLRWREGILLCTYWLVGRSVWSVCLSVCNLFLFPINNSRTPWPTFLKLCPLWFWGHWVKGPGHRVKCVKIVSDCLSNNFPKWVFSLYICATYFELTYPVLQNICDQKNL